MKNKKHKEKAELLNDMIKTKEFKEKMKFVREEFFPLLMKSSKSIHDAKLFLSSLNNILLEKFFNKLNEFKFSEFNLKEVLDKKDEHYEDHVELLSLFDDMKTKDARDYLSNMGSEIDKWVEDEMKERGLHTLRPKWLDEVVKNGDFK